MSSSELSKEKSPSIELANLRLLSINGVRKTLRINYNSAKRLVEEGKIKSLTIEGKKKVPIFRVHEYLQQETQKNETQLLKKQEVYNQNLDEKIESIISKHRR